MRLLLRDHVSNAREALRSNRTRTFLTVLGITIGVASITIVLALSAGLTNVIQKQLATLDNNLAIVRPAATSARDITQQQTFVHSTLTEADYEAVKTTPGVAEAAPLMIINGTATKDAAKPSETSVIATTPDLVSIADLELATGQFLDDITNQQTAVIGSQLSLDLFGTDQSAGQTFIVRGETFTVIGVLKKRNQPIHFNGIDFDRTAIIHLAAGKALTSADAPLQQISFQAKETEAMPGVIKAVDDQLSNLHQRERDFTITAGADIAKPTNQLFQAIQGVAIAIASISLIVGGIGVMNIMLVNVAERTREIGLRKAIGASNAHIVWQFMIESLVMSFVGGISGFVGGYAVAFLISLFLTFDPGFTWHIAAVAAGLSLVVGVIFGVYPAIKAARKDPIESLRQYH